MSVAVVQIRREPAYRREAVESGLARLGYKTTERLRGVKPEGPDDLLVVWNLKAGMSEDEATLWEQRGGTVIVMENGYLARNDKTHYAISTHGHNGAGWFPVDASEDRFSQLGFALKPQRVLPNGYILVCGQRGVGSRAMRSPMRWGEDTAHRIGAHARFRPHPGNMKVKPPLDADLASAALCVIWSSACGVRALVEGVPVAHAAPRWICERAAAPFTGTAMPAVVSDEARRDALQRMAHGQWHHEEIASGEPFARMKAQGWGPRWTKS